MFKSRNFLWKKGVLGSVWTAAHCLSKLKEKQVMETDIVACVDAILNGEADEPTCRILAHLLLGVVRIYSKKVEILKADFADLLHEANEYRAGKRANKRIKSYGSITIPETFALDAFNLDISEDQGVSRIDARCREDITLADDSRREIYRENNKYYGQEDISSLEAFSSANTPVRDVCSPWFMDFDLPPFDISILNARMEKKLVGTRFSSGKCLEPKMLTNIEKEPSIEINIQELARMEKSVHSESVEPMILGNAEEEPDIDMASNEGYQTDEELVHTDVEISCQELATTVKSLGNKQSVEKLRQFGVSSVDHLQPVILCQVEKESDSAMPSKGHQLSGEHIRHTDTRIYFGEPEEKSLPELTTPSDKIQGKNFSSISVNVSKGAVGSGSGSPELLGLHTPASKERARVLKKRKCLIDKEVIISNKVLEEQIKDPSDLVRKRNRVPSTPLEVWRFQKISNLPQSFFEPLIPCKAVELMSLISDKKSTTKLSVETSKIPVDPIIVETPIAQMPATPAETPAETPLCPVLAKSPAREMSVNLARTTPDPSLLESPIVSSGNAETPITPVLVESPVSQTSHEQTPAAQTPFTHSASLGLHEVQGSTLDEDKESDIELMDEEVNLSGSGNDEKCSWSTQTWRVATDLHRNISNMEQHKGDDGFLNLSQGLKSETRTECARRFYEILALKTGDYIDVKQEHAYGDILVQEKPKLKQIIDASGDKYLA